jgi:hypothetical protein
MMMTRMAKKSHTGDYATARPDDFGARGGGRRRGKPLVQSWRMEGGAGEDRKSWRDGG